MSMTDVELGTTNIATGTTEVTTTSGTALFGETSQDGQSGVFGQDVSVDGGRGVFGLSNNGTGVYASSGTGYALYAVADNTAIYGISNAQIGVEGFCWNGPGVQGTTAKSESAGVEGVDGSTDGATGVLGTSVGSGVGVTGYSGAGVGVLAASPHGTALEVEGPARFSRSGTALVAGSATAGATSVTVTGVTLTSGTAILATLQGHVVGVAVAGIVTNPAAGSFTIWLTKAVKVPLEVAWFALG